LLQERGNKPNSFHSESAVSLHKPAAVHCQVVTSTVLKPVCMMPCRNYRCLDRTHALTLAVRASGHQPSEDQCARSQLDTDTHTATLMCLFYGRDFAYRNDLHIHSLSIGVAHSGDVTLHRDITSGDATLHRPK